MLSSGIHPQPGFYDSMPEQKNEKVGMYRLNQVAIRLVEMPPLLSDIPLDSPEAAVKVMADLLKNYDREVVAIVNMQSDGRPINMNIVSMGALDQSIAHPREILKSTILSNAASIMMVHNHPSNRLAPSAEDIATTARIKQLCDLVGVRFLDHIIVGPGKDYYSFHQRDQIPLSSLELTRNIGDIELEGFKVAENTVVKEEKQTKKIVTLTVAECSEFHNLGEFHENIKNVAEAIEKFQAIPPERMHAIPGIGIRVADAKDPEDCVEMDIVTGKRIDLDMLSYVPDIADNWQAQQMIASLIHEMPEAEIQGEIPENIQKKINWLEAKDKRADELQQITDKLEKGVVDIFQSEKYKQLLDTMAKFPRYSVNNSILIMMQKPDAQLCQSYTGWKQMGRYVKKGEKGISILAPAPYKIEREQTKLDDNGKPVFDSDGEPVKEKVEVTIRAFKVVKTFDLSQTDGKEIPSIGPSELTGSIEGYPKLLQALQESSPVPVSFELIDGNAKGFYHQQDKKIVVQDGMSEVQTIKTLLHEMAHQQLHDKDQVPEAKNFTKNRVETEAESVAYVVCQHYGINTSDYSFSYVAGWSKNKETPELKASLDKIRQTAADFITKIDERLELSQEIDKVKIALEQAENPDLAATVNKELEKMAKQRKSVKSKLKEAETKPKKSTAKTKKKEEMLV